MDLYLPKSFFTTGSQQKVRARRETLHIPIPLELYVQICLRSLSLGSLDRNIQGGMGVSDILLVLIWFEDVFRISFIASMNF